METRVAIVLVPDRERGAVCGDAGGTVWNVVGNAVMGVSGGLRLTAQAARSMTPSVGLVASVCQPSTLRMVICPDASSAQKQLRVVHSCRAIRRHGVISPAPEPVVAD
jgi:hypothetical protein